MQENKQVFFECFLAPKDARYLALLVVYYTKQLVSQHASFVRNHSNVPRRIQRGKGDLRVFWFPGFLWVWRSWHRSLWPGVVTLFSSTFLQIWHSVWTRDFSVPQKHRWTHNWHRWTSNILWFKFRDWHSWTSPISDLWHWSLIQKRWVEVSLPNHTVHKVFLPQGATIGG